MLIVAATSAEAVGYRLELGVPAEIVIEAAVPACACPEPLPPVVQAAIATATTEPAIAKTATAINFRFLLAKTRISRDLQRALSPAWFGKARQ